MIPSPVRRATAADMSFIVTTCQNAQADFWGTIRQPVAWTPQLRQAVLGSLPFVATVQDGRTLLGVMVAKVTEDTAQIIGMATARTLPRTERIGVGLSLLLGAYDTVTTAGAKRGEGMLEATNDLLLDTFQAVDAFEVAVAGTEPRTTVVQSPKPHVYRITIDPIDEEYRRALEKAIDAL